MLISSADVKGVSARMAYNIQEASAVEGRINESRRRDIPIYGIHIIKKPQLTSYVCLFFPFPTVLINIENRYQFDTVKVFFVNNQRTKKESKLSSFKGFNFSISLKDLCIFIKATLKGLPQTKIPFQSAVFSLVIRLMWPRQSTSFLTDSLTSLLLLVPQARFPFFFC